jgi:uncharacterized hydrophobic protein (TIGR00341 family)
MADRFLEIIVPAAGRAEAEELVAAGATWSWSHLEEERAVLRCLVPAEKVEAVLDPLQTRYAGAEAFRAVVFAVEAALPRPPAPEPAPAEEKPARSPARVAREELYADLSDQVKPTGVFVATVVLSTLVAVIGLGPDNVAVVIGAMVIAPLLGPNMALALATTLGDADLLKRALRTNLGGLALAFVVAAAAAFLPFIDTEAAEVAARTRPEVSDVLLALAAGAAGALAFTSGVSAVLVGVMVAVALLPPLVTHAMLLVHGKPGALGALLLLAVNVICVNLAGVAVFLAQGIQPRTWWEASRSRRNARRALVLWAFLLAAAAGLVWWSGRLAG